MQFCTPANSLCRLQSSTFSGFESGSGRDAKQAELGADLFAGHSVKPRFLLDHDRLSFVLLEIISIIAPEGSHA